MSIYQGYCKDILLERQPQAIYQNYLPIYQGY